MHLQTQLLLESSKANANLIANYCINNLSNLTELISIFYTEKEPLPQKASWVLATINEKQSDLLNKHLNKFIERLPSFSSNTIKRNILHILSSHKIPQNLQGKLVDTCFKYMLNTDETVAVKLYAMQCIANISIEHPELKEELKAVITDQLPKTTAAFHARAKMVLKKYNLK